MAYCDVHPIRNANVSLEYRDQCYHMCSLYELDRLVSSARTGRAIDKSLVYTQLPLCGHTDTRESATWPAMLPGIEYPDGVYASASLPKAPPHVQPKQATVTPARVTMLTDGTPPERLRNALLYVLFATQDLQKDDSSNPRYQRWRDWAVSWLREALADVSASTKE